MAQHEGLPVAGYQPQSDERVQLVNENKVIEERLLRQIEHGLTTGLMDREAAFTAKTAMQEAFMWLNRAIFRPARVKLPED